MGKTQSVGVVVREYPLMGVDRRISYGRRYGMNINPEDTYIFSPNLFLDTEDRDILGKYDTMPEIAEEWNTLAGTKDEKIVKILDPSKITSMTYLNFYYAYNLAPVEGRSQRFTVGDLEIGIPYFSSSQNVYGLTAYMISMYFGFKQGYGRRLNLTIENSIGVDSFTFDGTASQPGEDMDFNITTMSMGYRFGVDLGDVLTRRLRCYLGASYKAVIPPLFAFQTTADYGEYDLKDSGPDEDDSEPYDGWNPDGESYWWDNYSKFGYSSWYQGGANLSITLSWSIRYSKYNLWGWLDNKKVH
jgi:hypothetical protein